MKKGIALLICVVVLGGAGVCLGCFLHSRSNDQTIEEVYSGYTSEYEVVSENSDGTYEVQIEAPDAAAIANEMLSQSKDELTEEKFLDYLKHTGDTVKTYTFSVATLSEDEITKNFFDEVAYDLAIVAIQSSDYEEGEGLAQ